jgi:hypothetical protein
MSSQSTVDMVLQRKITKLENGRKIERVERMVRDLQAAIISKVKDLEQKMERKELEQKMELKELEQKMEKNELEQKMEKTAQKIGKKDLEQKMERMQAQAALEKKDLEQKMERIQVQAALEKEKNERKQHTKRIKADFMMRAALENEKRDRLLENEKRDRLLETRSETGCSRTKSETVKQTRKKHSTKLSNSNGKPASAKWSSSKHHERTISSRFLPIFSTLRAQCFRLHRRENA